MDSQFKRGLLDMCILQMLNRTDMYGYEIVKEIQECFSDTEESTIYAVLRRLYKENMTDMYYSEVSNGPKRKYYAINDNGKVLLKQYIESINEMKIILVKIGIT